METHLFKVLYDPEFDSAVLGYNGMSLPGVICGGDESFRGLRMDARELAQLFDQFAWYGGIQLPEKLETMSLTHAHEWMAKAVGQCAVALKNSYRLASEFAKIAGPTDQYVFYQAASYGKLEEFNEALLDLVAEVPSANSGEDTEPHRVLEMLQAAADDNEWNITAAQQDVRRDLCLPLAHRSGLGV